jgi:hypothetical protein
LLYIETSLFGMKIVLEEIITKKDNPYKFCTFTKK